VHSFILILKVFQRPKLFKQEDYNWLDSSSCF
jgi:hypothetical protein